MNISIDQLLDGTYFACDSDMYDGSPDGNRISGRDSSKLKAVFELIDNLIMEGYPWDLPDEYRKCPYCGPGKGSVKSNLDVTCKIPLEFLPCIMCKETGKLKLTREQTLRNYYAHKIREFRLRGIAKWSSNDF